MAAIATFLHNIYDGIENILKQMVNAKGIQVAKSPMWHKDLLDSAVSNGIISEALSDQLYEYLTFRHFFVHSYGFMLEDAQLEHLARNVTNIWVQFISAVENHCRDLNDRA